MKCNKSIIRDVEATFNSDRPPLIFWVAIVMSPLSFFFLGDSLSLACGGCVCALGSRLMLGSLLADQSVSLCSSYERQLKLSVDVCSFCSFHQLCVGACSSVAVLASPPTMSITKLLLKISKLNLLQWMLNLEATLCSR